MEVLACLCKFSFDSHFQMVDLKLIIIASFFSFLFDIYSPAAGVCSDKYALACNPLNSTLTTIWLVYFPFSQNCTTCDVNF